MWLPKSSGTFLEMARVPMYSIHKDPHVLRAHVRIQAMTQVGNVVLGAKAFHHLLHQLPNLLLTKVKRNQQGKTVEATNLG